MPGKDGHHIPPEFFGLSQEEAQGLYDEDGWGNQQWEHFTPDFVGVQASTFDTDRAREHMQRGREIYETARLAQIDAAVYFQTDYPFTVFPTGDWHIGSVYTNLEFLHAFLTAVEETPNTYLVILGNVIDNAMPAQFPANMLVNSIPPDKQVVYARNIMRRLNEKGKILGALETPCHEGWTKKHTGQDVNALIYGFEGRRFPVLQNGGRLFINVPATDGRPVTLGRQAGEWQQLVTAWYHKTGPFNSNFNDMHSLQQMQRLRQNMECDIVGAGHNHVGGVAIFMEGTGVHRKPVAYVRSGTCKGIDSIYDGFANDNWATTGEPTGQSVTIIPRLGRMSVANDYRVGIWSQMSSMARDAQLRRRGEL